MSAELLGEVVSWDIHGQLLALGDIQESLRDCGLDPDEAHELTNRQAFGRACRELKQNRTIDKLEIGAGPIAKFQLTKKEKTSTGTIDFDYEAIVELNCDTGVVSCPESAEIEKQAQELLALAMQSRSAQDVTRIVQRLFKRHADLFPINRRGIAYFVPEAHREFTGKVDEFLQKLGGQLSRFPVPRGTEQGNASVKDAVQGGLAAMVDELNQVVANWDETTRKATMEKAFERYEKVAVKIDAYATYLEYEQDNLKEKLAAAKAELAQKIAAAHPAAEPSAQSAA